MILLISIVGLAATIAGGLILFAAITGEPPTPRRMLTRLTRRMAALTQTMPSVSQRPKNDSGAPRAGV